MPQIELEDISDDHDQESRWVAFVTAKNGKLRRLGQINKVLACNVPSHLHKTFEIANHNALYITCKGHWAKTPEEDAGLLANTEQPKEFIATGAILDLFLLSESIEESQLNRWGDYRVFQDGNGWKAEEALDLDELFRLGEDFGYPAGELSEWSDI